MSSQSIAGNESFSVIQNSSENFNILKTSGLTAGNIIVNEATIKTLNIDDVEFNSVTIDRIIMDPNVNIGVDNGVSGQSDLPTIAIGNSAGSTDQGAYSIAIGANAGLAGQGTKSIAIGTNAGPDNQASNTIILSAAAAAQDSTSSGTILLNASEDVIPTPSTTGFFVNPIRELTAVDGSVQSLLYNNVSKEITGGPVTVTRSISSRPSGFSDWWTYDGTSIAPDDTSTIPLGVSTIEFDVETLLADIVCDPSFIPVITWGSINNIGVIPNRSDRSRIVGCSLTTYLNGANISIYYLLLTISVFGGVPEPASTNRIVFDFNITYVPA